MNCRHLIVDFDKSHNKVFDVGGTELIRPDEWLHKEDDGNQTWMTNFNMKDVHPQVATIILDTPSAPWKKGDKVFLHYMAKETEEIIELDEKKYSAVDPMWVFFKIIGDEFLLADDTYLGEQVYTEAPRTESGIYLTPYDHKKEVLKIRITHLPTNRKYKEIAIGDVVCTADDYQYVFNYKGKDYIKLTHEEIIAKFVEA